jgi:hypothetical protein
MERVARSAAMTPAERAATPPGELSGGLAGGIDATTGEWVGYGLIGLTPIGAFRVKAGPKG